MAQRRLLLLLAALLLALMVGAIGIVGALLNDRRTPIRELSLEPPTDLAGFVRSAYDQMPDLPPLTLSTLEDGAIKGRIYVDGSGAVRIERYASPEATRPESYRIYVDSWMGELVTVDSRPVWHEQEDAISEDPRVFVFAALGAARAMDTDGPGCEVAVSPEEVYSYTPAEGWEYVGLDYVVGRPTHHVKCSSELWIDIDTRLTLRSRGPVLDDGGRPVEGRFRTIEVTQLQFGQPEPALFRIGAPQGAGLISEEEYQLEQCIRYGACLASPRPVEMPPPALGVEPPADLDGLIERALSATDAIAAFEATIEQSSTRLAGAMPTTRVLFDGAGRYRLEETGQPGTVWESVSISVGDANERWVSETHEDGSTTWRHLARGLAFPLQLPSDCVGGWQHVGVDLVAGRPADHVVCTGAVLEPDFWIDRETFLVLRTHSVGDALAGTTVQEVVSFSFAEHPAALFEPPV